jgi:putative DNA primase/helicase
MKYLSQTLDMPFMTPTGRLVCSAGYDAGTKVYLHLPFDYSLALAEKPTNYDVSLALAVMLGPWWAYAFATPDDAAGMVSAVLAAACRPSLGMCPAVVLDAPQQGSGKTKAALALGAVIEGKVPAVTPFAGTSTDDELRKRMVAGAVDGVRFHCIDNVIGHFKSSALAAVLTSGRLLDRVLGQSRMVEADIKALVTLTSNNTSLDTDLLRRCVRVRIDGGDAPTKRAFAFDPVAMALAKRLQIVEAALTVLRAYFAAGAPDVVSGDAGGWADWNRLCRSPVLWLAQAGLATSLPWVLGDPAASMLAEASDSDPELQALADMLAALWLLSANGGDFTAADAVRWVRDGEHDDAEGVHAKLHSAVVELVGGRGADLSARSMGRVMMNRRDRAVQGYKLVARDGRSGKAWRVVRVGAA